jgi:hypothetical protein
VPQCAVDPCQIDLLTTAGRVLILDGGQPGLGGRAVCDVPQMWLAQGSSARASISPQLTDRDRPRSTVTDALSGMLARRMRMSWSALLLVEPSQSSILAVTRIRTAQRGVIGTHQQRELDELEDLKTEIERRLARAGATRGANGQWWWFDLEAADGDG